MNRQYKVSTNPATLSRMGALEGHVQDEQERRAREKYAEFRENAARDLTAVEAASGGIPTFADWMEDKANA